MKRLILYHLLLLLPFLLPAQKKGYDIVNDTVVFTFDPGDYNKVTKDGSSRTMEFEDLDVISVAVSGEFNDWSKEEWRMQPLGNGLFQLKKALADLRDQFSWEFKYVVNGLYWAEPGTAFLNRSSWKNFNLWDKVYNLKLYTVKEDPNGNACFFLPGYENAKHVYLAGEFNQWKEQSLPMRKIKGGWELNLNLNPGCYQYRFVADGMWMEDSLSTDRVRNEFGEFNSLRCITSEVTFILRDFPDATVVQLAGDFTQWESGAIPMKKENGIWKATTNLTGGKHHYKFIVDGSWINDPENPVLEYDGNGHVNSVIMVR